MKHCSTCNTAKPLTEFYKRSDSYGVRHCCKLCTTYSLRMSRYGITKVQLDGMVKQKNCSICNKECELVIDHCHGSGVVRGMLCHSCNKALGFVSDSIETLKNAIKYLKKNGKSAQSNKRNDTTR